MQKIRKVFITNGIYWVEVPDADLYVLCGCPADSVKHMMRRGLIVTRKEKGVDYETGPNAILLSDVLVQNGRFANLAEFPVLQMLYRQGMILPGHSNNTGFKPILIGAEDQVKAQMKYIFRGNYGLISEDEMIETGVTRKLAKEMMRMKLKFAFGKIRDTEDLLDTRVVKGLQVEIQNGVFVRRLELNVFEFKYEDECVTVDLNLAPNTNYGVPYSLGFHLVKREYFSVIHSGDGDGWDINRPCMSSILTFQGKIYLIDTGPNILNTLLALGISINKIEGIFHTHAHDDHFADFATLMQSDHRIKYYATPQVRASVTKKLCALVSMEEINFPYFFEVHDLELDTWNNIEGLEVKPILSPHPVETTTFIFRTLWETGYKTYAHFGDIVSLDVLKSMVTDNNKEPGISTEFFEKVKEDYLTPVDMKKIDIGGGLIHGKAEDFKKDKSKKIILSHTSLELTSKEKEIGSGAPFGMIDILISANQNYVFRYAALFLQSYFPTAPQYNLRTLLNSSIITFNPESIILKGGEITESIYLVLTGNIEQIQSGVGVNNVLSAGAMVGEISGILGTPSSETYRAISFVQALRMPKLLYLDFVKKNKLYVNIKRLQFNRQFLLKTWLFGESISYPRQNTIAQSMQFVPCLKGADFVNEDHSYINLVSKGKLELYIDNEVFETLECGDFFEEEGVLFGTPGFFNVRAIEASNICKIPNEVIADIPIVRWRLFETFKKRRRYLLSMETADKPFFYWRDVYSVYVSEMDNHHKVLFERANKFLEAVNSDKKNKAVNEALSFLIEYTEFHFKEEEALQRKHKYPDHKEHKKEHEQLVKDVLLFKNQMVNNEIRISKKLIEFFKDWIIDHILTKDRKYGHFLNTKGIF